MCDYKYYPSSTCDIEPLEGRTLCIFHENVEEKEKLGKMEECMNLFYEQLDKRDYNFRGYQLKDVKLDKKEFDKNVNFNDASFSGDANFSGVSFSGDAYFNGTSYSGDANFSGVSFSGDAYFSGATFSGDAYFAEATFSEDAYLSWASFSGYAHFSRANFSKYAEFNEVIFNGYAEFREVFFNGYAEFREAIFDRNAYFSEAIFNGYAEFREAIFYQNGDFSDAKFQNLDFTAGIFERRGKFDESKIEEGTFENAELKHVTFRKVDLSTVSFASAFIEETYLAESNWTKKRTYMKLFTRRCIIPEECEADEYKGKKEKKVELYRTAEATYRNIKESLKREGDYDKAGMFYYNEMLMRRKVVYNEKRYFYWFLGYIISGITGYGEKPERILGWWATTILSFGTVYMAFEGLVRINSSVHWYENYYFSVVTFTTLGFGDIQPHPGMWGVQVCAMAEALLGAILMALFILVLGRRMIRG